MRWRHSPHRRLTDLPLIDQVLEELLKRPERFEAAAGERSARSFSRSASTCSRRTASVAVGTPSAVRKPTSCLIAAAYVSQFEEPD
jgi:hypothetical protein